MKHREDGWEHGPGFDGPKGSEFDGPHGPGEPIPEPEPEEIGDEPKNFTTLRRIEYIGRLHHMAFRSVLQENSLPPAQVGALKVIIRSPGMSQRELADALRIQRATATVMLQKMEKAGFIDRRPDREDQRISRIYPTQTAVEQDTANKMALEAYFDRCFHDFSPQELEHLNTILTRLGENIRGVLADGPEPPNKE